MENDVNKFREYIIQFRLDGQDKYIRYNLNVIRTMEKLKIQLSAFILDLEAGRLGIVSKIKIQTKVTTYKNLTENLLEKSGLIEAIDEGYFRRREKALDGDKKAMEENEKRNRAEYDC